MNRKEIEELGFELLELVDETDHTIAWKALQRNLDRTVVLRMLKPEVAQTPQTLNNFLKIARIMARIKSASVLSIFDIVSTQDLHYVVSESVDGELIRDLIAEKGALPIKTALQFALALAGSLDVLWRNENLVYRNLSCHTIRLTRRGVPKLIDFSWACVATDQNLLGENEQHIVDDPCFLAPEQIAGKLPVLPQTDMYAMGILLYQMLTGVIPFEQLEFEEVIEAHLTQQVAPPHTLNPAIHLSLSRFLQKLLAKDAQERPADWQSVIHELHLHLGELPPADDETFNQITSTIAVFTAPAVVEGEAGGKVARLKIPSGKNQRVGVGSQSLIDQHNQELEKYRRQRQLLYWLLLLGWFVGLFWYRLNSPAVMGTPPQAGVTPVAPDSSEAMEAPPQTVAPPEVVEANVADAPPPQVEPLTPEVVAETPAVVKPPTTISQTLAVALARELLEGTPGAAFTLLKNSAEEFDEREALLQLLERLPTLEQLVVRHMQRQIGRAIVFERDGKQRFVVPQSVTAEAILVESNNRQIQIKLQELTVDEKLRWTNTPRNEVQRVAIALALLNSSRSAEFDDLVAKCPHFKTILREAARLRRQ